MIEGLLILLGLLVLASPILAIVAIARTSEVDRLRQRVGHLERALRDLRETLERAPQGPRAPEGSAPVPEPAGDPERRTATPPAPPPAQPDPAPLTPVEAPVEAPVPQPPAAAAPGPAQERPPAVPARVRSASPAPPARPAFRAALSDIDWERWLGVRGAALAGGALLALAGLFFVHYSIQQGWIGPGLRVGLASAVGVAGLASLGPVKRRGYELVGESLGGAGAVLLYGAAWASYRLYHFVGVPLGFTWMVATTAAAGLVAWRFESRVVAVFAAVGGFATPLLLETWRGNPIGLFGYAFALDLALVALARRRGWRVVQVLALAGTALLQLVWALGAAEVEDARIGVGAVLAFGALFSLARGRAERAAGAAVAFVLAFTYALRGELAVELWELGLVVVPLTVLVGWVARRDNDAFLALGCAAATAGLAIAWLARGAFEPARTWQFVAVLGVAAAVQVVFARTSTDSTTELEERPELPVFVLAAALCVGLFVVGASKGATPDVWVATVAAVLALGAAVAVAREEVVLVAVPALALGAGLVLARIEGPIAAAPAAALGLALVVLGAWRGRDTGGAAGGTDSPSAFGELSARGLFAIAGVVVLAPVALTLDLPRSLPLAAPGSTTEGGSGLADLWTAPWLLLALVPLALAAARVARSEVLLGGAVLVAAIVWGRWDAALEQALRWDAEPDGVVGALGLRLALVAAFALVPWLAPGRGGPRYVTAVAPALFWLPPVEPWVLAQGERGAGLFPILLALVSFATAALARTTGASRVCLARHLAIGCMLAGLGLAREVDQLWPPVGVALGALGAGWAAQRLGHRRLVLACLVGQVLAALALLVGALRDGHFASSPWLLAPTICWVYLVPAAACGGLLALTARQLPRRVAPALGAGAALLVFAWINLVVLDAFEPSERLRLDLDRSQAQNLTQSLAWIVYALVLLAAGTARELGSLRWLSLAFLLAALCKVGLWDLGELEGLYRVASTAGLALALLGVSVLYQRFVFGRTDAPQAGH